AAVVIFNAMGAITVSAGFIIALSVISLATSIVVNMYSKFILGKVIDFKKTYMAFNKRKIRILKI
ncbi:MAG: hypothetical protein ACQERJ_10510, partial [Bacillota bacterium]